MAARKDGGGSGRKADKIIRDALLAVQRQEPERLKRVAEAWWNDAETDQQARNALADRLDGKAPQPIVGDDDHAPIEANLIVTFVKPKE